MCKLRNFMSALLVVLSLVFLSSTATAQSNAIAHIAEPVNLALLIRTTCRQCE